MTKGCNAWAKKSMFDGNEVDAKFEGNWLVLSKNSFNGWKIAILFYKVKCQNSLKAELTDSLSKLPGCSQFSRVGTGWSTFL